MKTAAIAASVIAVAGLGAGAGAYWYINDRAKDLVDARIDEMVASGRYDSAEYETLNVAVNGDITMTNLKVVQGPLDVTLRNITITNLDYTNRFPRHFDLSVDGLRAAYVANNNPEANVLTELLGQSASDADIPLELDYTHRYDPDNAHQLDSTMKLSVPEYFTLDASSVTRGIEMETLEQLNNPDPAIAQEQLLALMQVAEFPSAKMNLQDSGLVEDMLAKSAQQLGVSPADYRTLLISQAQNFYLFLPPTAQTFAMAAGAEMAEFLEGGKTLSVSLAPEYGGSLQRLQQEVMGAVFTGDYNKVSELLHLEIITE
jgi:hypothetical protein